MSEMMNRRNFLKALGVGSAALSTGCLSPSGTASAAGAQGERPNIILCMTDDQGWGDVSYNGLTQVRTAALDTMAAEGMRFNRFYAGHPSCSPTRASVMTGRHPNRMGCFWPGMKLRTQEVTIAQAVKRAGYTTGHFGKWHLNGVPGAGKPIEASDVAGPVPPPAILPALNTAGQASSGTRRPHVSHVSYHKHGNTSLELRVCPRDSVLALRHPNSFFLVTLLPPLNKQTALFSQ